MTPNFIFLDNKIIGISLDQLKSLAPAALSGQGVFETMKYERGRIHAFDLHVKRLNRGLRKLKIKYVFDKELFLEQLKSVLSKNHLRAARVRLTVWKDKKGIHISIITQKLRKISQKEFSKGFKCIISKITRPESDCSDIKSIDYKVFERAYYEAQACKVDESILLNKEGFLVEGSRTNVFFIKGNVLCTPDISCGALPGITREIVLECAKRIHLKYRSEKFLVKDLLEADEAFLTNSLIGIMPLSFVNMKRIGVAGVNKFTRKLARAYRT